jgi:hypothetical protein
MLQLRPKPSLAIRIWLAITIVLILFLLREFHRINHFLCPYEQGNLTLLSVITVILIRLYYFLLRRVRREKAKCKI